MRNSIEKTIITRRKYHYTPLDSTGGVIRLLRLLPTPDSNDASSWPIRCSLFTTKLDQAPPYTALSYAWGEKAGSQTIFIDSDTISVTNNLRQALSRLRPAKEEQELVLWVDAICINQDDVPERNVQTANMRAIYQHANRVAVWLGLHNHDSRNAINLAHDLNTCATKVEVARLLQSPKKKVDLEALVLLFRRQYWWRIWVIQEVSSAKDAIILCGDDSISWTELENVCEIMQNQEDILKSIFYKFPSYVRTLTHGGPRSLQLSRYSGLASPPLLELLISHKSKKSTDPKDKVYALVGISDSRNTFGEINYSLSMREIYTYTARHIISTTRKLDVICVKQHDINQFDLPSWTPDWTRPPPNTGTTMIGLHHHQPSFTAAGTSVADVSFHADGFVLQAKGILIDTILTVGIPFKNRGLPSDSGHVTALLEVFHDWWNIFVASHSNSLSSQARFGRAISCGNWKFEKDEIYAANLEAIFALGDDMLSESDLLRLNPPTRTNTMGSSISCLIVEDGGENDSQERTRLSAILSVGLMMNRRRLFLSEDGFVGMATQNATVGDLLCVLMGCRFPVILRPQDGHFTLIGEAYVEEFMNGEAIAGLAEEKYSLKNFDIH